ncbi:MAG: F0F1 ATP synthase subunit delta [Methylococcales bacterium]|nr:F0F1 ATP synthase subunit delta [Methylococcales bacterium]MCK5925812.1 F0F1 ATP synthase subunit delta [Methylococcales bacterium]
MSELSTLARPYAEAVFKRALETETTEKWSTTLAFVAAVVNDITFAGIIDNPKVSDEQLTGLLLDICQQQTTKESENFLKLLIQNNRLTLADAIYNLYEAQKAEKEGYIDVDVRTAYAFTKDDEKKFSKTLKKELNKEVRLSIQVDKSLIGGFIAKAGDLVIDGSVKGQLQIMQKTLQ